MNDDNSSIPPKPAQPQQALAQRPPQQQRSIAVGAGGIVLRDLDDIQRFANIVVRSGFYVGSPRDDHTTKLAQTTMKIAWGLTLGMTPMAAMQNVIIVEGQMSLRAHCIASQVMKSGRAKYRVKKDSDGNQLWDGTKCVLVWHVDGEEVGESSFTIEEARQAGLGGKKNWQSYPKAMLFARAMSQGARTFVPFVFEGQAYTPDELGSEQPYDVVDIDANGVPRGAPMPVAAMMPEVAPTTGRQADVDLSAAGGEQQRGSGKHGSDQLKAAARASSANDILDAEIVPADPQGDDLAAAAGVEVVRPGDKQWPKADGSDVVDAGPGESAKERNERIAAEIGDDYIDDATDPAAAAAEAVAGDDVPPALLPPRDKPIDEPHVEPDPAGAAPPDDVPAIQVEQPKEEPKPDPDGIGPALVDALLTTPTDGKTPPMVEHLGKSKGKLTAAEYEDLRLWGRYVVAFRKDKEKALDGLDEAQRKRLAVLQSRVKRAKQPA